MDILTKVSLWLIALALWGLLLRPLFSPTPLEAGKRQDVNIDAVGGRSIYRVLPVTIEK